MMDENILPTADIGIGSGMGVADVGAAMQRFGWADYVVFVAMLLVCVMVGLYFCFIKSSNTAQEYLIGGRTMSTFPISMSLIASYISGISLLGIPTEIYVYGIQYMWITGGILLMALLFQTIYLPVFHNLQITSTYEYLEMRFDRKIRIFGSLLFSIEILTWLPLVIYVPALAFNQVTGVNVHLITPAVCVICIFYTTVGGLKAVVWTDVIQIAFMVGAIALVAVKGTFDVGGLKVVLQRNWNSGRIEAPNFDTNPLTRHTVWALVIGGSVHWLQTSAIYQNMMQRYLALPTLKDAQRALWIFVAGIFVLLSFCSYCGMLIYATYYNCDPLTTKLAREKDQLLPLLVMEVLNDYPGLPGLFVAGIFSAALSSLSTGLNSMAAVILEDFYRNIFTRKISDREANIIMKTSVILLGAICVGLVVVVENLGAVLQLTTSIGAIAGAPSLALFGMGVLLPWVTAKLETVRVYALTVRRRLSEVRLSSRRPAVGPLHTTAHRVQHLRFVRNHAHWTVEDLKRVFVLDKTRGALFGGASGLIFMCWLCYKAQTAISSGDLFFNEKPVSTDGCHYNFTPKEYKNIRLSSNVTEITHTDKIFIFYHISYLWFIVIGTIFGMIVGLLVSYFTKPLDPRDVDKALLAPFIRQLIPAHCYPNQPQVDEIIFAYPSIKPSSPEEIVMNKIGGSEST